MEEENEYETTINMKDSYVNVCEIEIPERFNTVILKLCPEIREVVTIGYKSNSFYDAINFEPTFKFLVAINIFFNENDMPKGSKEHYEGLFNDYFKMTYGSEMDFITFKVESMIVPPVKTNEDKFFELFKKKVDEKKICLKKYTEEPLNHYPAIH
jgi:hypothetical protein